MSDIRETGILGRIGNPEAINVHSHKIRPDVDDLTPNHIFYANSGKRLSRREFLRLGGLLGTAAILPPIPPLPQANTGKEAERRNIFEEIKTAYEGYGVPCPYTLDGLKAISSSETNTVKRPNAVLIATRDSKQAKMVIPILQTGYELFGENRASDFLHTIEFTKDIMAAEYWTYTMWVPRDYKHIGGDDNSWRRSSGIHEFMHLVDRESGVHTFSRKLNMELLKARALFAKGVFETYSKLYINLDNLFPENFFFLLGKDAITNAYRGLVQNDPRLDPEKQFIEKELIQTKLVYGDDGNIIPELVAKFSDYDYFRLGRKIMEVIKPAPNDIPDGLKAMVTGHFKDRVVNEATASLYADVLMNTGSWFSTNPKLVENAGLWMRLAQGGNMDDGPVDMKDLRYRLRYRSGKYLKWRLSPTISGTNGKR